MPVRMIYGLKMLYAGFLLGVLYLETLLLGFDVTYTLTALAGSIAGALMLTYYSTGITPLERVLKVCASAIAGIIIGAAVVEYFQIKSIAYIGAVFFLTAFLALTFLHALLVVTDKNATGVVTTIFQKIFRINNDTVQKETKIVTTEATRKELQAVHDSQITETVEGEKVI